MQAKEEIFWTAFRSLKRNERVAVLEKFFEDKKMLEDIQYALIIEQRKHEPNISLDEYLLAREK
jgi:hypothetical protein